MFTKKIYCLGISFMALFLFSFLNCGQGIFTQLGEEGDEEGEVSESSTSNKPDLKPSNSFTVKGSGNQKLNTTYQSPYQVIMSPKKDKKMTMGFMGDDHSIQMEFETSDKILGTYKDIKSIDAILKDTPYKSIEQAEIVIDQYEADKVIGGSYTLVVTSKEGDRITITGTFNSPIKKQESEVDNNQLNAFSIKGSKAENVNQEGESKTQFVTYDEDEKKLNTLFSGEDHTIDLKVETTSLVVGTYEELEKATVRVGENTYDVVKEAKLEVNQFVKDEYVAGSYDLKMETEDKTDSIEVRGFFMNILRDYTPPSPSSYEGSTNDSSSTGGDGETTTFNVAGSTDNQKNADYKMSMMTSADGEDGENQWSLVVNGTDYSLRLVLQGAYIAQAMGEHQILEGSNIFLKGKDYNKNLSGRIVIRGFKKGFSADASLALNITSATGDDSISVTSDLFYIDLKGSVPESVTTKEEGTLDIKETDNLEMGKTYFIKAVSCEADDDDSMKVGIQIAEDYNKYLMIVLKDETVHRGEYPVNKMDHAHFQFKDQLYDSILPDSKVTVNQFISGEILEGTYSLWLGHKEDADLKVKAIGTFQCIP